MSDEPVYTKEFAEDVVACAKQLLSEVHLSGGTLCAYCSEKTKDDKHWLECTKHPSKELLFPLVEALNATTDALENAVNRIEEYDDVNLGEMRAAIAKAKGE